MHPIFDFPQIIDQTMVKSVRWSPSTESTNSDALKLAGDPQLDLPALIGTDLQTGGRGRGHNRWWASRGSLTFSLVISPDEFGIQQLQWPRVSLAVGLAVANSVDEMLEEQKSQLKWPNDIYIDGKKLGGILVETTSGSIGRMVIGIGINISFDDNTAVPQDLQSQITSLQQHSDSSIRSDQLLTLLLNQLESELRSLGANNVTQLDRFRQSCFLTGKFVSVTDPAREVTGLCLGIDDNGALQLQNELGVSHHQSGTVRILGNHND